MIVDNDLLSIQHARILVENATEAQKRLASFSQEALDAIVSAIALAVAEQAKELAIMAHDETDCGSWQDKLAHIRFVCGDVLEALLPLHCVGVLAEDRQNGRMDIGVPLGVIASLLPVANPVAAAVHQALMAIKAGNAIVFSPHPRAVRTTAHVVERMAQAACKAGLPDGCLACLEPVCRSGAAELMRHKGVALVVNTGVPSLLPEARAAGKPLIYAGTGQGPAFVERTADIAQAARDIVQSKTFDNGMAPAAEQAVVVEACILESMRTALASEGCHFMTADERQQLGKVISLCGSTGTGVLGMTAENLAQRAGFTVPKGTRVLVALCEYVNEHDVFSSEIMAPVLSLYVEADWRHACEKCIEVLLHDHTGHTLTIHSRDEDVIRQFALKKPVGRLLVNTPATFGAMGMTTSLTPSVTLGSGSAGFGMTADNVSPFHFIYVRTVGYGVRRTSAWADGEHAADQPLDARAVRQLFENLVHILETSSPSGDSETASRRD